jgi:signal transduction histidine kinase
MTFAWRSTLDEVGTDAAERWACGHEELAGNKGLLVELATAVMETACDGYSTERPAGATRRLGERLGQCLFRQGSRVSDLEDALESLRDELFELGRVAVGRGAGHALDPRDSLELAVRLERAVGDVRRGATESYAAALSAELRSRYRVLRHEMRNSLGTIRTSLALMSDESLPEETRSHPRLRDMLGRNAHLLDTLILDALSDTAATGVLSRLANADGVGGGDRRVARVAVGRSGTEFAQDFGRGDDRADVQPRLL